MYKKIGYIIITWLLALFLLGACVPPVVPTSEGVPTQQPQSAQPETAEATPTLSPTAVPASTGAAETALKFYELYQQFAIAFQPALGNHAFDAQKYLSPDYLKQVAEIQVAVESGGFDPVMQSQMVSAWPGGDQRGQRKRR